MRLLILLGFSAAIYAQDAREIIRRAVGTDQENWRRAPDYTWTVQDVEKRLDSNGNVKSEKRDAWETVILYGEPHRRFTQRNGKPLTAAEQRKQQESLDKEVAKLRDETPQQREQRLAAEEKERRKNREFLLEIPEAYDLRLERDEIIDGRGVWVISATPKNGYRPRRAEARDLLKVKARIWIDKTEYQWVRIEAESIATLTWGLFIGRINPGAKLVFEQTRVNDEIWLPRHFFIGGNGRLIGKKISLEEDIVWSNFHKFHVDANIVGE